MTPKDELIVPEQLNLNRAESGTLKWTQVQSFLRTYWRVVTLVFVTAVLGAYVVLSLTTEYYGVGAQVLVKIGRENLDPPAVSRNQPLTAGLRLQEVYSEARMLTSPVLLAEVVDQIGPENFNPVRVPPEAFFARVKFEVKRALRAVRTQFNEVLIYVDLRKRLDERQSAIYLLTNNLSANPLPNTDVVDVGLAIPDPLLGERVLNSLLARYLERRIELRRHSGVKEYLNNRLDEEMEKLTEVESRLDRWKVANEVVAPTQEKSLLLQRTQALQQEESLNLQQISGLRTVIERTKAQLETTPEFVKASQEIVPNPLVTSIRERVASLESERVELLAKYLPEAIPVQNLDREIARLKEMLKEEARTQTGTVRSEVNPLWQNLQQKLRTDQINLDGLESGLVVRRRQIMAYSEDIRRLDQAETELRTLERRRGIAEGNYLSVSERNTEAEVADELDRKHISNVSILSEPTASLTPVRPRKLLIMAVMLPVGLLLGVGLAMGHMLLRDVTQDPNEVERALGVPCLGAVQLSGDRSA